MVMGFDAAVNGMDGKGFAGVVLSCDVSEKTEKEVRYYAERRGREVVKAAFSMDDTAKAVGKRAAVFLVSDEGLFKTIKQHIAADSAEP